MKILIIFFCCYLWLPFIGLFYFDGVESRILGPVSDDLIHAYLIYNTIFTFIVLFSVTLKFNVKRKNVNIISNASFNVVIYKSLLLILVSFVGMIPFGVIDILLGDISRGELRANIGFFGFFYNFFSLYLPSLASASASFFYLKSKNTLKNKALLSIVLLFSALIGFSTGFKFTSFLIVMSSLVVLSERINIKMLFSIFLFFLILMSFSAYLFMGLNFLDSINYIFHRATAVAVEGSVAIWNLYPNGAPNSSYALLYGFGNRLASLLTGLNVHSVDFLKINITRLIGYLTYPDPSEALSGAFNLTVTNFGESVYYFGRSYNVILSILGGSLISFFFIVFSLFRREKYSAYLVLTLYITLVLLPWLFGGTIASLFAVPSLINMGLVYIFSCIYRIEFFK